MKGPKTPIVWRTALTNETASFTQSLTTAPRFADAFDEASYVPVPDSWVVAVTDVVRSRAHIEAGRYKAVNMAGVAMISAAMNELGSHDMPYVFGGDGAAMVFAPQQAAAMASVLARVITMVGEELELELRAALVPVSRIRKDGFDVKVEAVRVSAAMINFAFTGGGVSHAEKLMKQGEFRIEKAQPGARPDLTGLSCRWTPIKPEGRKIVSIIAEAGAGVTAAGFAKQARLLLALLGMEGDGGSPIPRKGPGVGWPVKGMELEARATRAGKSLGAMRLRLLLQSLFAWVLFKTGISIGGFNPARYQEVTGLNTDFRKVQDGLRMTVSLSPPELSRLEAFLEAARHAKHLRYGLAVQDSAILTCYVPSVMDDNHFHFLDGAGGGYAAAATAMRD